METLQIRKISEIDLELLQIISIKTFKETFENYNSKEDMDAYLDKSFTLIQLKEEISNPNSEFYFAESNDKVIGYLKVNFNSAQTEIKDNNGLEIERIYVLTSYQKKQIGQQLFKTALSIAKKRKCNYLWLGVWEKNLKAINFYKKNGFTEFDKHTFLLGNDKQTDILMKLTIV